MPFFMVLQPFLQECLYRKMGLLYLHKAHGLVPQVGLLVVIFWVSTTLKKIVVILRPMPRDKTRGMFGRL